MKLENIRIRKEMQQQSVNRKVNCETANIRENGIVRQSEQIEDIRYIETHDGLLSSCHGGSCRRPQVCRSGR